jgi:solute carrier family 10 (sodium/bile acid cotransporter), member 7
MSWLRRLRPDGFLLAIVTSAVLSSFFPARGLGMTLLHGASTVAIFLLFFLYGARIAPREALRGLAHWRLHLTILSFTFLLFPLIGLALRPLSGTWLSPQLYSGLLYLCLVPSTVQSSIAFTSIARGNVPGAIVSASASNLLGVFVTPALVVLVMAGANGRVGLGQIGDIVVQLLLPFVLGQVSQRWTAGFVKAHNAPLKLVDRGVVVLVVYTAFSQGMSEHMWSQVNGPQLVVLVAVCLALLALMLVVTWYVPKRMGFSRVDNIAIQFCGTKKSLATGLPMAQVLFAGTGVGLLVLPLMIFHQAQLMACSVLAQRYARADERAGEPSTEG